MYRIRIVSRLILLVVILAAIPLLAISNVLLRDEARRAKSIYQTTAAGVQKSGKDLADVEASLTRMTTSVSAVETEARRQLRMVKPGETFVLVEQEKSVVTAIDREAVALGN
ncbi:hypothetical protein BH09SUM1_BH09SUM1_28170 [soil metagenome]